MSYARLLRLPPPSEAVGPHWRRKLSACARLGSGPGCRRTAVYKCVRAHSYGLQQGGGDNIFKVVGNRVVDEVCTSSGKEGAAARRADATNRSRASTVSGFQTNAGHGATTLLRSRQRPPSSTFREAPGSGWDCGWGGMGAPNQSLRAFASTPPDPAAKPSHYSRVPRQRTPLGDLLKPSDVSNDHCRMVTTA